MALCPEPERSLSLLEPGGGGAEQQQQRERRADAAPMPVVFLCAGCRRPLGNTSSWAFSVEESGRILLRRSLEKQGLVHEEPLCLESQGVSQEVLQRGAGKKGESR
ncbi:hypothetical protein DUI87_33151 [Hirundo rustica rustica]|uniref:Mis18 domain-containing protein n=1 Tax=Hirundo rustica rustica TaxID=333673 RepID=A0A3M0IRD7_HIRRU|nr:hypothetical protein DUI87_33151 [Hirundo rustica rustica]